jgi:phage shock protein A
MATKTKEPAERDVIRRLAARGEETLHRLAELPGGTRALRTLNDVRGRVEELTRRMRGLDELEARVEKLEKQVAALKRTRKTTTST